MHLLGVARRLVRLQDAALDRLAVEPVQIEPRAVVAQDERDLVALLPEGDADAPALGLAGRAARRRRFDAVDQRIAQHVLERRADLLQHAAVELDLAAFDLELRLLLHLARRLPHGAVEALVQVREWHRAHAHQFLLHVAAAARLLLQRRLAVAEVFQERLLDRGDVVQALRHHPRQLLQAGVAVELQRIEFGLAFLELRLARLHLAVGLHLDFAQLAAQPRDAL